MSKCFLFAALIALLLGCSQEEQKPEISCSKTSAPWKHVRTKATAVKVDTLIDWMKGIPVRGKGWEVYWVCKQRDCSGYRTATDSYDSISFAIYHTKYVDADDVNLYVNGVKITINKKHKDRLRKLLKCIEERSKTYPNENKEIDKVIK